MNESEEKANYDRLAERVQLLERRLTSIESILRLEWQQKESTEESTKVITAESTESRLVEYGLAWLGGIVFLLGILFFMSYIHNLGYPVLSVISAYIFTLVFLAVAYSLRTQFPVLLNVLFICIPLLLFYITLKLHFFTEQPLIATRGITLILLLLLVAGQFMVSIRKNSEFLASISITLLVAVAIINNSDVLSFILLVIAALTCVIFLYTRIWWKLLLYSLILVYLAHLIWLLNNPLLGHSPRFVEDPQYSIIFLMIYGVVYALTILIPKKSLESNGILISITIWNAMSFSFILLMMFPVFYKESYYLISTVIAIFCLGFSVFLFIKYSRNFAPATYACFGFMAMTVAIYGYLGLPTTYLLLVLQSFLVVSVALWYRSQIIVVVNSILFLTLLIVYFSTSESLATINFSFAFTALATARILNWKKERLTLRTELFRNIYLGCGFIMLLYSLNHSVTDNYITLSWTAVAIAFFILSILLRNIKYRYLSILALGITGCRLFIIDMETMEVGYRVIAFLVFAVITLSVSLYYSKRISKR